MSVIALSTSCAVYRELEWLGTTRVTLSSDLIGASCCRVASAQHVRAMEFSCNSGVILGIPGFVNTAKMLVVCSIDDKRSLDEQASQPLTTSCGPEVGMCGWWQLVEEMPVLSSARCIRCCVWRRHPVDIAGTQVAGKGRCFHKSCWICWFVAVFDLAAAKWNLGKGHRAQQSPISDMRG